MQLMSECTNQRSKIERRKLWRLRTIFRQNPNGTQNKYSRKMVYKGSSTASHTLQGAKQILFECANFCAAHAYKNHKKVAN